MGTLSKLDRYIVYTFQFKNLKFVSNSLFENVFKIFFTSADFLADIVQYLLGEVTILPHSRWESKNTEKSMVVNAGGEAF